MPLVTVYTSAVLPAGEKLDALQRDLSASAARLIGKPESYVMTCLVPHSRMTFGGSFDPSCLIECKSIGGLGKDVTAKVTAAFSTLAAEVFGVPTNRIFVVFSDVPAHFWGFDGDTLG
jgi:phenylpyruvate tautomerase PptA (4-oxalocrotonate tautomerase family)